MKLKDFLILTLKSGKTDRKTTQFLEDVQAHPEIGEMNAWVYFRSALRQVECPSCVGRLTGSDGCTYCGGTGKVDFHLTSHPMNVHGIAKEMDGTPKPIIVDIQSTKLEIA